MCAISTKTQAQACGNSGPGVCTPQGGLTAVGFYPSDTTLPCADDGAFYNQTISFLAPSSVSGYSLVDVQISSINNLPCGLCWASNSSSNQISGGGTGCVQVSGITKEVPGQYNIVVYATATVNTGIIGDVTVGPLNIDSALGLSYVIRVNTPGASQTACPPINGTSNTASVPGSISPPTITGSTSLCSGGSTTLTATGGSYYGYAWSNGVYTASNTVSATGTYKVTVYDNCNSATASVNVQSATANSTITPSGPTSFCQGGSVTLTATQGNSYLWSDGETTQSILVTSTGNYSVDVTLNGGCVAGSSVTAVTVSPYPSSTITASGPTTICSGGSVTLSANAGAGGNYIWSTNAITSSINVNTSGTYYVTVTNAAGCSATSTGTVVTVSSAATASVTASGPTTFCPGGSVTLTAQSGTSYVWSNGATTQAITVSAAGNYVVTVTLSGGCSAISNAIAVSVTALTATISITGNSNVCSGGSVILTASAGTSYLWSTGATTQSITVSSAGNYVVTVTSGSCQAVSAPTPVNLSPTPTITPSGPTTFTSGGSVLLTATPGSSYLWNNGVTSQSITVSSCGVYTAIVYFPGGCASATAPVTVTVNP